MKQRETREQLRDRLWIEASAKGPKGAPVTAAECATVVEQTLTDGSAVYDVRVSLGGTNLVLHAINSESANEIAASLNGYSLCGITVLE